MHARLLPIACAVLLLAGTAHASPITVSSGDISGTVNYNNAPLDVYLTAGVPSSVADPASLMVRYGLWSWPEVTVQVSFNGTSVGEFYAEKGYGNPGPAQKDFAITGLVRSGVNQVHFEGTGGWGDYIVGQVDMTYLPAVMPEPATMLLISAGLFAAAARRRKER